MAWTYNPTGIAPRDRVRLLIGDTDELDPQISDEEIDVALADNGLDVLLAGLDCCVYLQARSSSLVTETQAGLTENWDQRQKHYADLAVAIRALMVRKGRTGVYRGAATWGDKDTRSLDPDRVQPAFAVRRPLPPPSSPYWVPPAG